MSWKKKAIATTWIYLKIDFGKRSFFEEQSMGLSFGAKFEEPL